MLNMKRIGIPLALAGIAGIAVGATLRFQAPATPATPQVAGQNGGPTWHDSQDIGNGVELETVVKFCENVTIPSSGSTVRPLSIHMNFLYGVGLMQQIDYLQLQALGDATPLTFNVVGVNRNTVVAQRPPFEPLDYLLTLSPKSGYTWGTIQGAVDVDIVAVQQ